MRKFFVRVLFAAFAVAVLGVPAEAQRRARDRGRVEVRDGRRVEVDFRLRNGRPSLRMIAYDRWYYAPPSRYHVSLRRLARVSRHAFRRALRDHRALHRAMRRAPVRRAERMHRQWHRQKGWSHREFVMIEDRRHW